MNTRMSWVFSLLPSTVNTLAFLGTLRYTAKVIMSERLLRILTTRRARRTALLGLLWSVIAISVFAVREVLLPFFIAAFLAYVIDPVVRRLAAYRIRGKQMPRWGAVISLYLAFFALTWVFFVFFVPRLYTEVARLATTTGRWVQQVDADSIEQAGERLNAFFSRTRLPIRVDTQVSELPIEAAGVADVSKGIDAATPPTDEVGEAAANQAASALRLRSPPRSRRQASAPLDPSHDVGHVRSWQRLPPARTSSLQEPESPEPEILYVIPLGEVARSAGKSTVEALQARTGTIANRIQLVVGGTLNFIFKFFLVLMLTAFLAADTQRITRFAFSVVAIEDRERFDDLLSRIDTGLSGVVRGQITICIVNGALTLIGLLLFKVKFAFVLATVAAIFSLVPIFGSIASTLPIVFVALATSGIGTAFIMLLWIAGIHALEANLLNPKIMGDAARIHPFLVVLALITGEHFYGIAGALFAVPLLSIGLTLFKAIHARAIELEKSSSPPALAALANALPSGMRRRIWREPKS